MWNRPSAIILPWWAGGNGFGRIDYGAGIRLFCGNRVIYAFVNDTSEENLVRTAREMASTVKGTHLLRLPDWKTRQWQNINPIFVLPDDVEKREKADYLAAASAAALPMVLPSPRHGRDFWM